MREPSFRHDVRARELKSASMAWTEVLELEAENWRALLAAEITASPIYKTTMDRVRAFPQRRGGCRATYFNHCRKLGNGQQKATNQTRFPGSAISQSTG